mmetsp:Transcript_29067/g.92775  ORF Transcript_29067/g.92775 Transcript_29067/m.92775 type:complete len:298 (-) Transcript_29067:510-1403(-)
MALLRGRPIPHGGGGGVRVNPLRAPLAKERKKILRGRIALLGRIPVPGLWLRPVLLRRGPVEAPEVLFGDGVALLRGCVVPFHRARPIALHAVPPLVTQPEVELCHGISLLGRLHVPPHSLLPAVCDPQPALVAEPDVALGGGVALSRGLFIPAHSHRPILQDPLPIGVAVSEVALGPRVALSRRAPEPSDCIPPALRSALPARVEVPQVVLGNRVPLVCRSTVPQGRFVVVLLHSRAELVADGQRVLRRRATGVGSDAAFGSHVFVRRLLLAPHHQCEGVPNEGICHLDLRVELCP